MQRQARVTSKGQITIPHEIRRVLGVQPGDTVEFESGEDGVKVRPVRKESPFAKYRGIGTPGIPSGRKAIIKYFRDLRGW
ncbi:MAG TPA: AbrB/MazE/SpoVT family DNA-binding domain-containing protein [Bryobacteraceae bacterium]|nr:AbrB/MazE/SpoVT family DNA-binding domain-containing protein [Bryobacteraceae bacterium]